MITIRLFFILVLTIYLSNWSFSQTDWKKELVTSSFKISKHKKNIPLTILNKIGIDSLNELANPFEKWDASCAHREPNAKLNWVSTDYKVWVICITTGGYSLRTHYYFISSFDDTTLCLTTAGRTYFKFKTFKENFLSDKIKQLEF